MISIFFHTLVSIFFQFLSAYTLTYIFSCMFCEHFFEFASYFSNLFKRNTSAVVAISPFEEFLGLIFVLLGWFVVPFVVTEPLQLGHEFIQSDLSITVDIE